MNDAERAFWSTAAQLGAVFGLALVIETRFAARTWRDRSVGLRIADTAIYGVCAAGLVVALAASLIALGEDYSDPFWFLASTAGLGVGISAVILAPIQILIFGANYDWVAALVEKLPWTKVSRAKRAAKRTRRATERRVVRLEGYLQEHNKLIDEGRRSTRLALASIHRILAKTAKPNGGFVALSQRDLRDLDEILELYGQAKDATKLEKKRRKSVVREIRELVKNQRSLEKALGQINTGSREARDQAMRGMLDLAIGPSQQRGASDLS